MYHRTESDALRAYKEKQREILSGQSSANAAVASFVTQRSDPKVVEPAQPPAPVEPVHELPPKQASPPVLRPGSTKGSKNSIFKIQFNGGKETYMTMESGSQTQRTQTTSTRVRDNLTQEDPQLNKDLTINQSRSVKGGKSARGGSSSAVRRSYPGKFG